MKTKTITTYTMTTSAESHDFSPRFVVALVGVGAPVGSSRGSKEYGE